MTSGLSVLTAVLVAQVVLGSPRLPRALELDAELLPTTTTTLRPGSDTQNESQRFQLIMVDWIMNFESIYQRELQGILDKHVITNRQLGTDLSDLGITMSQGALTKAMTNLTMSSLQFCETLWT